MELRQLVYFEAVVRYGGFSRAGEQLRIAQPAVSAQIRRLEAELGTPLLQRTTRRVALTEAGELFLVRVRSVLEQLDLARAELGELTAVLRGRVRIGATLVLSTVDLPAALARFHRRHPSVTLTLRTGFIADLRDALDSGELDLVVGPLHSDLFENHPTRLLAEERVVLVTAPGHPAVGRSADGRRTITLADLRNDPFVCLPPGTGLRAILTAAAARAGFEPRVEFEADNPAHVRELVAVGLGVALLAESAALVAGAPIDVHRLDDPPEHPPIGCILPRHSAANPATRAVVQQLAESAGTAGVAAHG